MKSVLTLVPFLMFGASGLSLMFMRGGSWHWLPFVALGSFVASLLLVPIVSRKSLARGYGAVIYLLFLLVVFSFGMSFSRPDGPTERLAITKTFVNRTMRLPLETYRIHIGHYPTTAEGLVALINCPKGKEAKWKGPYVNTSEAFPSDPWGHPYQYRSPGVHNSESYDLWSFGPDGKPSDDDIGNLPKY